MKKGESAMINKNNKIGNIEELKIGNLEEHYEDLAIRYSNIESKIITASSKEELINRILIIAAQLTGVSLEMAKQQHNDEIEECWEGKGEYYVIFKLYGYGQEMVIDVIRLRAS